MVAGIDGGGTRTTLELWRGSGEDRTRRTFGPFNLNSIGEQKYRELLSEIFEAIAQSGECSKICIGAAGISNPDVGRIAHEAAEQYGFSDKLVLKGDQEIALYGAMSGGAGAILISGTGSICNGRDRNGRTVRVGGWGHLIDDVGSGYAIGRDVLTAVVRAYDGRGEKTVLTELVQNYWGCKSIGEIIAKTYLSTDKSTIAALSHAAEDGASAGDSTAKRILRKNAEDLCELAATVYRRLGEQTLPLCLMGGLLTHQTIFRQEVETRIKTGYEGILLKQPDMDAASGAALWAWNLSLS